MFHAMWSTHRIRARGWAGVGDCIHHAVHWGTLSIAGLLPDLRLKLLLLLRHLLPLSAVLPLEIRATILLLLQRLVRIAERPLLLAERLSFTLVGGPGVGVGGVGALSDIELLHLFHGDKNDVIEGLAMT